MYCLVVTDDYSRFTWVFFLATKDETSGIVKSFITGIENLVDYKVKLIRSRTPQQNGVAERRNRTLIEVARTMLADSKLPTTFWAEAVNTACYTADPPYSQDPKSSHDDGYKPSSDDGKKVDEDLRKYSECKDQEKEDNVNSTNNVNTVDNVNTVSSTVNVASINEVNAVGGKTSIELPFDPNMPALEDDSIFDFSRDDEDDGAVADINNLDTTIQVSPNPTTRIHKDHPLDQVIGDLKNPKRIEAIRLFLAYASFKDFMVYQMDVKSAFLYGKIEEEVYVCQPPGFEDPDFPDRVYKVEKVLYGLRQAPRAWYETLSTYLLDNGFQRGKIDKTLFIKRHKGDILLVQVYVDDIIFGSTKKDLCIAFEKLMHEKFQMSSMGELTFFLGLQVKQKKDGIFISQDIYVAEILKKFRFIEVKTASTPMETQKHLLKDEDDTKSSKVSHLHAVKRIFRLISWQCKKQTVVANSTTEAEYVAASSCCGQAKTINGKEQLHALVDGKKIIITESSVRRDLQLADEEGIDCLPNSTIFEQLTLMGPKTTAWNEFSSTMASAIICLATNQKFNFSKLIFDSMIRNLDSKQAKFLMYPRKPKRKDTQVPQSSDPIKNVADEAVHKELGDSLVRAATTASSLEAEQDSGNINKTQSKETPNESSFLGTTSGGGPRCQKTMGDTIAQTRFENVSKHYNDSLLARGNRLQSEEDRLKLNELMALCTTLQNRILDLKKTKTSQHNEIASLKRGSKSSDDEESLGEDASKQGSIDAIDLDEEITLVSVAGDIVSAASAVTTFSAATTTIAIINNVDDITLAQALEEIKSAKPKKKGIVIHELGESTTTISSQLSSQQLQDKGKGVLIEPVKPMKKKDQISLDEETALNLQAAFDEEERLQKVEDEKETAELKQRMEIIPDEEEVAIDAIPLAVKSPSIVGWKIHKERRKNYYQIMRADGKSQTYMIFSHMLKSFDRKDLENLYKLVKAKYKSIRLVEDLDLILWGDLKTMFEPHIEDKIYMLVEKKYPLTPSTLTMMLEKKLMIHYESEMAYQLLKFIMKQLKK
ncbi:retrovirus-related pol polyprotein from transposon TNT 1-94 [Tanacetum coccineum]